jgi:hypothetical protein
MKNLIISLLLQIQSMLVYPVLAAEKNVTSTPEETVEVELVGKDTAEWESWIGLINALAIGYVTASLVKSCPKMSSDLTVAAGAGIIYISAEIASSVASRKISKKIKTKFEKSAAIELSNTQVEALLAEKEKYDDLKKVAKTKSMIQLAAATAFLGAAGVAYVKGAREEVSAEICALGFEESIVNVATMLPLPSAVACLAALKIGVGEFLAHETYKKVPNESKLKHFEEKSFLVSNQKTSATCSSPEILPLVAMQESSCNGHFLEVGKSQVMCEQNLAALTADNNIFNSFIDVKTEEYLTEKVPKGEIDKIKHVLKNIFLNGVDIIIPESRADIKKYLGLSAVGAGIITGLIATQLNLVDHWISTPIHRAIIFGSMGASISYASFLSNNISVKMNQNAEEVDHLIQRHREIIQGKSSQAVNQGAIKAEEKDVSANSSITQQLGYLDSINEKTPCLTRKDEKGRCGSLAPLSPGERKNNAKNLGGSLSAIVNDSLTLANEIQNANGISAGTINLAQGVASKNAFALRKIKNIKNKFNEVIEKNSTNPKSFSANNEFKKFENIFNENSKKLLASKGFNPQNFKEKSKKDRFLFASLGSTKGIFENSNIASTKGKEASLEKERRPVGAKTEKRGTQKSTVFELSFKGPGGLQQDRFNASFENKKVEKKRLSLKPEKDRRKSIFKMLTERYMLTAYPILFNKKKLHLSDLPDR